MARFCRKHIGDRTTAELRQKLAELDLSLSKETAVSERNKIMNFIGRVKVALRTRDGQGRVPTQPGTDSQEPDAG